MSDISTQSIPIIIGHTPAIPFTSFQSLAALRSPAFLPDSVAEFLFATNVIYWIALAAVALAAVYVGRSRAQIGIFRTGLVLLAATAVWILSAYLIDTPRERLDAAHRAILHAAETKDAAAVVALLAPDFRSEPLNITRPETRQAVIAVILNVYHIRSNTITALKMELFPGGARSDIVVFTELEDLPMTKTRWQLEWIDDPASDWRLRSADLQAINDQPMPDFKIPVNLPH